MRRGTCARTRRRAAAVVVAALLVLLVPPTQAMAEDGRGDLRRRIGSADAEIARLQDRMDARLAVSTRAAWLLFEAKRALDIARIELRDARFWYVGPDEMRRALLIPTPEEQAVAEARARYRTLLARPRVGGVVERTERLQARVVELGIARARLSEELAGLGRPAVAWGPGTPDAGEWADAFLAEIGAPACTENRILVVAWQAQESTAARFNPLATTHAMPGATDFNSVGVKNYRSVGQGLAATRETLELPAYGYEAILSSIRACNDAEATAWFVNASAWCRGCTDGAYLTGLLPSVRADFATYAAR